MQLVMQESRKNVKRTLLKELKKNRNISWSKIIVGQSGRDTTQIRNDEKVLKSN